MNHKIYLTPKNNLKIGVLALQGAFAEHINHLKKLNIEAIEVRTLSDLNQLDGIILPGGESTAQRNLLIKTGIFQPLQQLIKQGLPVLATCAGMILLAQHLENDHINSTFKNSLATIPITVCRNAFGRQLGSFYTLGNYKDLGLVPFTFIRAPYVSEYGEGVEVLSIVKDKIVAVQFKNQICLAFHPELNDNLSIHQDFIHLVFQHKNT